jgi:hypothetical protein
VRDIDLLKKMSDARVELGAALYQCQMIHDVRPFAVRWKSGSVGNTKSGCDCDGCILRDIIERALNSLEP